MIEHRLALLLRTDEKEFTRLTMCLSLADLLNGVFLIEGQSETIGAYAGAIRFLGDLVGRDELFRRPEPPATEPEKEPEPQHKLVVN